MHFRLYLLKINELEDDNLQQKALSLMDSYRKGKINKYKTRKDRLHQIATGLLLQIGILELDLPAQKMSAEVFNTGEARAGDAVCDTGSGEVYLCEAEEIVGVLEKCNTAMESLNKSDISEQMQKLQKTISVPVDVIYEQQQYGKPYWQQDFLEKLPLDKRFKYFSISHSGEYAALVIADAETGLDIQEERLTRFAGGCQKFSRMESYVKCTGEGYAKGYQKYKETEGAVQGYCFYRINALPDYVIYLCHENLHY